MSRKKFVRDKEEVLRERFVKHGVGEFDELVPVFMHKIGDQEVQCCDARTLWQWLGTKTKFNDWIKRRIEEYTFIQENDYSFLLKNGENSETTGTIRGRSQKNYAITLDMSKQLCMLENTDKGKQVRKYFIECEKTHIAAQQRQVTLTASIAEIGTFDDKNWLQVRFEGKEARKEFVSALADHGLDYISGCAKATNDIYIPLFGGKASDLKAALGLAHYGSIRDNLSKVHLAALRLVELLIIEVLKQKQIYGNSECIKTCGVTAQLVAKPLEGILPKVVKQKIKKERPSFKRV